MTAVQAVLAFDFGKKRIGIASGDTLTRRAAPLAAVVLTPPRTDFEALAVFVKTYAPALLVVGSPYNADGSQGALSAAARDFACELKKRFRLPVYLVDERYSSLEAQAALKAQRASGARRRRVGRADLDPAAAAVILERFFEGEGTLLND
jgi:putative holliday junction resolvase